ncbi:MAG TPA: hypothetical protein VK166_09470 [Chitinophagaceae bacterium]|nr:hypothetical protein [Chitinophagaceae bacterium]
MKKTLVAVLLLSAFACNTRAPKTEPAVTSEFTTVVDSAKGVIDFAGPDVDLVKKLLSSVEKADWDAARACFADSAVVFDNQWAPDTTQKGAPVSDVLAFEKKDRDNWENISFGEPIIEVATTANGDKYAHIWARYSAKNKKSGKTVGCPVFASYLIKDGKLQWEWAIYDSKKLE